MKIQFKDKPLYNMSSISVTQALAEIKLTRSRMENALDQTFFIKLKKKRDMMDVARFSKEAVSSFQSYTDLVKRYNTLKSAVVQSNAVTTVSIAGNVYTVADAVERKRTVEFDKQLLTVLQTQYDKVKTEYDQHMITEQARVERLVTTELSKDNKTNVDVVNQLTETFLAQNRAEILDPLGLADQIRDLKRSIEEFETQVDWVLSESNGKTLIQI
jgi:hypothetical protein